MYLQVNRLCKEYKGGEAISSMAHRILKLRSGEIVEDSLNSNILPPERIEW